MSVVKLHIAYDGTDYAGWQIQQQTATIQGEIESALNKLCGKPIRIHGAGRTDSGVHAINQVASFKAPNSNLPLTAYQAGLNSLLDANIRITKAEFVADDFHAQQSAREKVYEYYMGFASERGMPLHPIVGRYAWILPKPLDDQSITILQKTLKLLEGTRDFAAFCASGSSVQTTERTLFEASCCSLPMNHPVAASGRFFCLRFRGSGFLKQMVRNIVGTAVEIATDHRAAEDMLTILHSANRQHAGKTAPANGLFLIQVIY